VDRSVRVPVWGAIDKSGSGRQCQGRIHDLKLGGTDFKKLRRAEGGSKILGIFRVKNHDFTPKNNIFSNFRRAIYDHLLLMY
jgi:hypothetical protein